MTPDRPMHDWVGRSKDLTCARVVNTGQQGRCIAGWQKAKVTPETCSCNRKAMTSPNVEGSSQAWLCKAAVGLSTHLCVLTAIYKHLELHKVLPGILQGCHPSTAGSCQHMCSHRCARRSQCRA